MGRQVCKSAPVDNHIRAPSYKVDLFTYFGVRFKILKRRDTDGGCLRNGNRPAEFGLMSFTLANAIVRMSCRS